MDAAHRGAKAKIPVTPKLQKAKTYLRKLIGEYNPQGHPQLQNIGVKDLIDRIPEVNPEPQATGSGQKNPVSKDYVSLKPGLNGRSRKPGEERPSYYLCLNGY